MFFAGLYIYAIVCGWLIHLVVRSTRIDRKYQLLRFDNDWYYQFTGEVLDFPDYRSNRSSKNSQPISHSDVDGTLIAAVVELKERSYLYLGFYVDSFYDASGNLDRILLDGAKRRELSRDPEGEVDDMSHLASTRYYPIKGNYLLLRMSEVKTLNLTYYSDEFYQLATDNEKFGEILEEIEKLEGEAQEAAVQEEIISRPRPPGRRRAGGRRPRGGPSR